MLTGDHEPVQICRSSKVDKIDKYGLKHRETEMALKEIIVETQANLRADAANAKAVFSVDS